MQVASIDKQISVCPQIMPEDVPDIAQQGFRSIICNRPDGEAADQPTFEEIEAAAKKFGLEVRYQPITAGKVQDEDADAFGAHLALLPKTGSCLLPDRDPARQRFGLCLRQIPCRSPVF